MKTMGRIPVSVATPTRRGGWDAGSTTVAKERGPGGKAAAVLAADRARGQQLGGVSAGRDQPQDRQSVAVRADGRQFRRGAPALSPPGHAAPPPTAPPP